MNEKRHDDRIRQEFSKQASSFGEKGLTLSSQDILEWIVSGLPLQKDFRVLDVAAGTGHLTRAIAPHVQEVVSIDITPEMLEIARRETAQSNLNNITIDEGNAADLPYEDASFDMVVSRLALHHFEQPIIQLQEMVRVCKPYHKIGIIDLLSPEDEATAVTYNRLERLRDPSHTTALSKSQLLSMIAEVGLTLDMVDARDIMVDFQRWVQMTGVAAGTVDSIKQELRKEIDGKTITGMRPYIEKNALKFQQVWAIALAAKLHLD